MRARIWLALIPTILLAGCSASEVAQREEPNVAVAQDSEETSPRASAVGEGADAAGNYPADILMAYIRARNRADWKTAYSLMASPKPEYEVWLEQVSTDPVPWDDFIIHETEIDGPTKARVRVTYATIGFSAAEGMAPEEQRTVVVVREPGEWWVLERGPHDDAVWKVTLTEPED